MFCTGWRFFQTWGRGSNKTEPWVGLQQGQGWKKYWKGEGGWEGSKLLYSVIVCLLLIVIYFFPSLVFSFLYCQSLHGPLSDFECYPHSPLHTTLIPSCLSLYVTAAARLCDNLLNWYPPHLWHVATWHNTTDACVLGILSHMSCYQMICQVVVMVWYFMSYHMRWYLVRFCRKDRTKWPNQV